MALRRQPRNHRFQGCVWRVRGRSRLGISDQVSILYLVIPNEVRDLQFAAKYRSLTSLGMTIQERSCSCTWPVRDEQATCSSRPRGQSTELELSLPSA